jgi:hypothetical protein
VQGVADERQAHTRVRLDELQQHLRGAGAGAGGGSMGHMSTARWWQKPWVTA